MVSEEIPNACVYLEKFEKSLMEPSQVLLKLQRSLLSRASLRIENPRLELI